MKTLNSKLAVLATALALCVGMAVAQDESAAQAPSHHARHGHFMGGMELGLPLHELNLTDEQKAQVKQIFQTEKPTIRPLMRQEMTAHQQMIQLVTGGAFDPGKASTIAAAESQTHILLEVEHAKIASQIYQLLTADQKAKASEMINQHLQRMQQHLQNEEHEASPSE